MKSHGFLDNLPDLGIGDDNIKRKKKTAPPKIEAIIWKPIRCPECKSANTKVVRTKRPIRYHKCGDCGHNFKSVEVGYNK